MSVTLKNVTLANGKTANVSIDGEHITAVGHDEHGEIIDCSGLVL
ncbi:MAG: hypothetical protein RJA45_708, partial [Actinomycetota bacterium]